MQLWRGSIPFPERREAALARSQGTLGRGRSPFSSIKVGLTLPTSIVYTDKPNSMRIMFIEHLLHSSSCGHTKMEM